MPVNWPAVVEGMTRVQKLVHLSMRFTNFDVDKMRSELVKARRRAYEDELTIQAKRVGCGSRRGNLVAGPSLSEMNEMSRADAESIINTYNFDLAGAILNIAAEVPTANRNTYARRLSAWEVKRNGWKIPQIAQNTEGTARSMAQADFVRFNDITGFAVLRPRPAVEPICIGWVARGQVPLRVAINNPFPVHQNCPHLWEIRPGQVAQLECPNLWVGN